MENKVVKYNVDKAAIAKMADIYMNLTITDLDDKKQFEMVHHARMVMVGNRVAVEKRRVELKADALAYGRKVDGGANELFALMAPIEAHLIAEEKPVIEKEKRIKAEKEEAQRVITQDRVEQLQAVDKVVSFDEAGSFTINDFLRLLETETMRFDAEKKRLAQEEAARKAEDARLEKVKAEQDAEAERLNRKNEKMRVEQKEYDDKQEALRVEREAEISRQIKAGAERLRIAKQKIDLAQQKIDDDKAGFKAAKKAERDRVKTEREKKAAEEVAKFLADEKAEADAKRKKQADMDAEIAFEELKKRQEALRPDKEKLKKFGYELLEIRGPELADLFLQGFLSEAIETIHSVGERMLTET